MEDSKIVVLTGMHRSGTSLISNILHVFGIHMGDELEEPLPSNPYGHYEDKDFLYFQEEILLKRGLNYLIISDEPVFFNQNEKKRAEELLQLKSIRKIWGWKDPRTSLFLESWYDLLPTAQYLLIYRHPIEVLISLIRRADLKRHGDAALIDDPLIGLRSWEVYNNKLYKFHQNHTSQSILCNIQGILEQPSKFIKLISTRIGLSNNVSFEQIFDSGSWHHLYIPKWINEYLDTNNPNILVLYNRMQALADIPYNEPSFKEIENKDLDFFKYFIRAYITLCQRNVHKNSLFPQELNQISEKYKYLEKDYTDLLEHYNNIKNSNTVMLAQRLQKYPLLIRILKLLVKIFRSVN